MLVGITTPGFIQNWREKEEKREGDDANEKGRDEKGTSGSHSTEVTNLKKMASL